MKITYLGTTNHIDGVGKVKTSDIRAK